MGFVPIVRPSAGTMKNKTGLETKEDSRELTAMPNIASQDMAIPRMFSGVKPIDFDSRMVSFDMPI
jgi:hypothetical protein